MTNYVCFDKFVTSIDGLPTNIGEETQDCNYWRDSGNWPDLSGNNDFMSLVTPRYGCCDSGDASGNTTNIITNKEELNDYLTAKKNAFNLFYITETDDKAQDIINKILENAYNSDNVPTSDENDTLIEMLKNLHREFISLDNDIERVTKKLNGLNSVSNTIVNTNSFSEEYKKLKQFSNTGKAKKIEYFDENSYALYESFFYTMLIIISILFIRNQVKH